MPLFCKDCQHAIHSPDGNPYRMTCNSPQNVVQVRNAEKYLVTGIEQPMVNAIRGASCTALRMARDDATLLTVCGPDGLWFEAKE